LAEHGRWADEAQGISIKNTYGSTFKVWLQRTRAEVAVKKRIQQEKESKADLFANRLILMELYLSKNLNIIHRFVPKRFIRIWYQNVVHIKEERYREWRKQQLRNRIQEMLVNSRFEEKLNNIP
jgi:hypothetical protein